MNLLAEALVWLLTSAICSTFYKKLLLHKSNCKRISGTVSQANAIYNLVQEYWQFLLCCYERLTCPVAVSVSAVVHEATCHCKSELYLLFPIWKRECGATPGKTGPDLYAQVEAVLFLYGLTVRTDTRTQNVLTRSVYQHPTNMAVLFHIPSSSLMLCPSHGNP